MNDHQNTRYKKRSSIDEANEEPLCLLTQFVSVVTSAALKGNLAQSDVSQSPHPLRIRSLMAKFSTVIRDLCENAPGIAQWLVREILKHVSPGDIIDDFVQG